MTQIHKTHRLVATILLVALLIPMIAVIGYASEKVPYYFDFVEDYEQEGKKNDVGTSTGGTAGVSITEANFGLGNVRFYLRDAEGNRACNTSARYTTLQNSIGLTYNSGAALYNNCTVTLVGIREGNPVYVEGNFQP